MYSNQECQKQPIQWFTSLTGHESASTPLDEFSGSFKIEGNDKPVMIATLDGDPDENSRYMKRLLTCDLDALSIAINNPDCSPFNRVERRMVPLSKEMADLILDHKHFGNHLNNKG